LSSMRRAEMEKRMSLMRRRGRGFEKGEDNQ